MGQVRIIILIGMLGFCSVLTTRCQIEPAFNKLVFNNSFEQVADSIYRMEKFLKAFPQTHMVNYFVDSDGFLYLNNQKVAPLKGAINNPKVRRDMVFQNFRSEEIDEFFFVMAFLWRNGLQSCHMEPIIGTFLFSLEPGSESKKSERFIIVVDEPADTSVVYFNKLYKVIDRRDKLFLIGIRSH